MWTMIKTQGDRPAVIANYSGLDALLPALRRELAAHPGLPEGMDLDELLDRTGLDSPELSPDELLSGLLELLNAANTEAEGAVCVTVSNT